MAINSKLTFILASASPARRRLLNALGIHAAVMPSHFDESSLQIDNPAELVETLAECKAETVGRRLQERPGDGLLQRENTLILGCDSLLVVQREIYGKPADEREAIARWERMSGDVGELHTGHALIDIKQEKILVRSRVTRVYFAAVDTGEIAAYVATGEPLNCAGCFAIEGKGGAFVDKLEGCHTNVIGLSLPLLREMLRELGYQITDFWKNSGE
jgi:septum formation protein